MTREEAIKIMTWRLSLLRDYCMGSQEVEAVEMAVEALKEPKARCLKCDFLKSCMHAWEIDCGCEFYQVDGVRPREGEE